MLSVSRVLVWFLVYSNAIMQCIFCFSISTLAHRFCSSFSSSLRPLRSSACIRCVNTTHKAPGLSLTLWAGFHTFLPTTTSTLMTSPPQSDVGTRQPSSGERSGRRAICALNRTEQSSTLCGCAPMQAKRRRRRHGTAMGKIRRCYC